MVHMPLLQAPPNRTVGKILNTETYCTSNERLLQQMEDELLPQVGNTPVCQLQIEPDRTVWLKFESENPSGSIKVRPAAHMMHQAIRNNDFAPNMIVAESTSGNTGIGVAWVCHQLGIEYHNYSPKSLSAQKREMLNSYGAKLFFADGGTDQATQLLKETMAANPDKYFWPSQFTNDNNWRSHSIYTAPELLKQVPDVEEVWCGFGSGGTSTGFAHALANTDVALRVVQNTVDRAKRVEGMRNLAWISKPPIADLDAIGEENMYSADPDALLPLAQYIYEANAGFIVGPTTAAILTQAIKSKASCIVIVSPDNGVRYPEWVEQVTAQSKGTAPHHRHNK